MGRSTLPSNPTTADTTSAANPAAATFGSANGYYPITSANAVRRLCPVATRPGEMECFALERVDLRSGFNPATTPAGYGPADIQSAYNIPSGGTPVSSKTIVAIVDAFGYKQASSDLAKYRTKFGLPACTTGNNCLKIVGQTGGPPPKKGNAGWYGEQALDLDMVSASCPSCHILLVEAKAATGQALYTAVATANKMGAAAISNSYGGNEAEASDPIFAAAGSTYVASSGDQGGGLKDGGGPQQPCTLPTVVCVGGTHLVKSGGARGWAETTWNDLSSSACGGPCGATGSGCSTMVAKPSWQTDTGCTMRSASDISAVASVFTPVAIYCTPCGGWQAYGGTSASSPIIAGMIGITGNGGTANVASTIWGKGGSSALNDITSGTNILKRVTGPCASSVSYICKAGPGYDGPTGWGSPEGTGAL